MFALFIRRAAWMVVFSGLLYAGLSAGIVLSQDSTETKAEKASPAGKSDDGNKPKAVEKEDASPAKEGTRAVKPPPVLSAEVESPNFPEEGELGEGNIALQAVGGLGIGHIQSTLGLIGVTADAFAKETYDDKKVDGLMTSTITGIDVVKKLLRKLQDEKRLSADDEDFIDRMMAAYSALQREARALAAYAKSKKSSDAEAFAKARRIALEKIDNLTGTDDSESPSNKSSDPLSDAASGSRDAGGR